MIFQEWGKRELRRMIAALAALILLLAVPLGTAAEEGSAAEEPWTYWETGGFDTPEDAILQYLSGLKACDPDRMLGVFAWETLSAHSCFRNALLFSGYYPELWPGFPEDGGFLSQVNAMLLCARYGTPIRYAMRVYLTGLSRPGTAPEDLLVQTRRVQDEAEAEAVIADFSPSRLGELAAIGNVRVFLPEDAAGEKYGKDRIKNRLEQYREVYGAEEICERAVGFTIGDRSFGFAPVLGRYAGRWYLIMLSGQLSGMLGFSGANCAFGETDGSWPGTGLSPELGSAQETAICRPEWEGNGFSTPEEAVQEYLDGLKELDLSRMLRAFAWETMEEQSSMKQALLYYGTDQRTIWPGFPSDGGMLSGMNLLQLAERRIEPIRSSLIAFVTGKHLDEDPKWMQMRRILIKTEQEADGFLAWFDWNWTDELKTLGNIRISLPEDVYPGYSSEKLQETREKIRNMYGADEVTDRAAAFSVGGRAYAFAPQILRYGDRWYLGNCGGMLSALLGISSAESALCRMD